MIKKRLFILIIFSILFLLGCGDSNKKSYLVPEEDEIKLNVTLERDTTSKHPLDIIVKLSNISDKTVYYENYYFPKKSEGILNDFFFVMENNVQTTYNWIKASRSGIEFTPIQVGETHTSNISLDKLYVVHKGNHDYNITLSLHTIQVKTTDGRIELSNIDDLNTFPDGLTPDEHTSKTIMLKINPLQFNATIHSVRATPNKG